jgi:6-phosphogluconolactonase
VQPFVFTVDAWAKQAARYIINALPGSGVVVLTGGGAAQRVYSEAVHFGPDLGDVNIFFSDERCVPPSHAASNFRMVDETLLSQVPAGAVHRMRGEEDPEAAAAAYDEVAAEALASGIDVAVLGLGSDGHIAGLFPHGAALEPGDRLCLAVRRPDGLDGLTLTPPVLTAARHVLVIAFGSAKADAVRRVVAGDEPAEECPGRVLADHPRADVLIDEPAAARL